MNPSVLGKERIESLDMIRGIAIVGIFLVNIPAMTGLDVNLDQQFVGVDKTIRFLLDLFVQTKFYAIFSFLFGLGFYIFMSRAEARGDHYIRLFSRRLVILFIFGALHYCLFWDGDILHTYAMIGFLLLLFYNSKPITILVWSILLFGLFHLFMSFTLFIPHEQLTELLESTDFANYFVGLGAAISERASSFFTTNLLNQLMIAPEILSLFLLGLLVGKINLFQQIATYKRGLRISQIISFGLFILFSIPIVISYVTSEIYYSFKNIFWITISGKALAVFYVTSIILLAETTIGRRLLQPFKHIGRMALTNYITQTIFGVVILSIFVKNTVVIPLWALMLFVLIICSLQAFFSKWWLSKYQFGPLEWLWRIGTYKKVQPIVKKMKV